MNYREEEPNLVTSKSADGESGSNPNGRLYRYSDGAVLKTRDRCLRFGTWNVRTLHQSGKLNNALREMKALELDILGIAEYRWTNSGKIVKDDFTFIFSGGQSHRHGVGLIMKNSIAKSLSGFWPVSDRIIIAKLISKPFNIFLIQVYAPAQEHEDEVVERFYADVESCLQYAKSDDMVCIMGDFNARVGSGELGKAVGKYGLGSRDERGERLIHL